MLVSRSPLKGTSSLQHKKIGVWNHLSQELLDQIANKYQLQVEWIRFNGGVNIFLSKAVDICLVGSYNEFLQLIEAGIKTDSIHIMRFSDYGYNLPEDGLYVSREFYQKYPQAVQKLARASMRGWEWANDTNMVPRSTSLLSLRAFVKSTSNVPRLRLLIPMIWAPAYAAMATSRSVWASTRELRPSLPQIPIYRLSCSMSKREQISRTAEAPSTFAS